MIDLFASSDILTVFVIFTIVSGLVFVTIFDFWFFHIGYSAIVLGVSFLYIHIHGEVHFFWIFILPFFVTFMVMVTVHTIVNLLMCNIYFREFFESRGWFI